MNYPRCEVLWTNEKDGKNMSIIMCFQDSSDNTISFDLPILVKNSSSNPNKTKNNLSYFSPSPSIIPSVISSELSSFNPSLSPSQYSSNSPSVNFNSKTTVSNVPSINPNLEPSLSPSQSSSLSPSQVPNLSPSQSSSLSPSQVPNLSPSQSPSTVINIPSSDSPSTKSDSVTNTTAISQLIAFNNQSDSNTTNEQVKKIESDGDIITITLISSISFILFIIFGILIVKRKKNRVMPCADKKGEMVKKESKQPKHPKRINTKPKDYLIEILTENPPSPTAEKVPDLPPRIRNIKRIMEINRKLKVLRALKNSN
jgi:hypothetical protein